MAAARFLHQGSALVLLAAILAAPPARAAAPAGRPNILVIMSDEHNASVLGCYGNRIVKTPNIDRLAASGVLFEAAYTNSPLCVPCRLSFTSGKYISRTGAWNNNSELPSDDYPSIARVMTAAGYDSVLCGKMHYDRTRRYGFTEIGGNMNNSQKNGKGSRRRAEDLDPKPGAAKTDRFDDFRPGDDSSVLKHDRRVTAAASEFLRARKSTDKPFFLFVGLLAPHFPLIVPEKYWQMYKGNVPMPQMPEDYLDTLPRNYLHLRVGFRMTDVPPETVQKGRELYYGLTTWMDEQVGEVLSALQQSGQADSTVVIYTTDHGENMGEHGLWWKNAVFDSAARVPLIISWPQRFKPGQRRGGACSLVDLVQTIADLGGARTPDDWDGDSLVPWIRDPAYRWKDLAVSEYYAHNIASGYVMLRRNDYKYVYHTRADETHGPERELYDLKRDSAELHNLAGDPAQQPRIQAMHAALLEELGEDPELTEHRCRTDIARGYDRRATNGGRSGLRLR